MNDYNFCKSASIWFINEPDTKESDLKFMKKNMFIFVLVLCLLFPMVMITGCSNKSAASDGTTAIGQSASGDSSGALGSGVSLSDSTSPSSSSADTTGTGGSDATPAGTTKTGGASTSAGTSGSDGASQTTKATDPAATTSDVIRVSIPEGYTLAKICLLLEKDGVNSFGKLFSYATSDNFSQYSFLPAASSTPNRCFQLEGYLYPDTYDFYLNESPASVWKKFLDNFQQHADAFTSEAQKKGMTLDQAVVLASLIEKESNSSERANVSAVIHNRLSQNMKLDIDSTYTYYHYIIEEYVSGDLKTYYNKYYTYLFRGLPAGAICNPGSSAIEAAINPSDIKSLYFFTDKSGNFVYSDTLQDHESKAIAAGVIIPTIEPTPAA